MKNKIIDRTRGGRVDRTNNITLDEIGFTIKKERIEIIDSDYFYGLKMVAHILKMPNKVRMDNMNKYFLEIANLVQKGSNILSFGKNKDGSLSIVTKKQLSLYLDVGDKTILNLLWEYKKANIIASVKVGSNNYYIMNPEYAIHKGGVNSFVFDLFNIKSSCISDDMFTQKKHYTYGVSNSEKNNK